MFLSLTENHSCVWLGGNNLLKAEGFRLNLVVPPTAWVSLFTIISDVRSFALCDLDTKVAFFESLVDVWVRGRLSTVVREVTYVIYAVMHKAPRDHQSHGVRVQVQILLTKSSIQAQHNVLNSVNAQKII